MAAGLAPNRFGSTGTTPSHHSCATFPALLVTTSCHPTPCGPSARVRTLWKRDPEKSAGSMSLPYHILDTCSFFSACVDCTLCPSTVSSRRPATQPTCHLATSRPSYLLFWRSSKFSSSTSAISSLSIDHRPVVFIDVSVSLHAESQMSFQTCTHGGLVMSFSIKHPDSFRICGSDPLRILFILIGISSR